MSEKAFQTGCDFEAGKEIDFEAFTSCTKPCWGHFHFYHEGTADYLRNKSGVDEFVVDAMLAEETRPRFVEVNGSGCLVILRAINFHPDKENEDMVSVRLWIEPKRIISVVKQDFRSADEVKDLILRGVGPKTVGEFMVVLIKHILGHMEPVIAELDERTVGWEEEIPENAEHDLFSHLSETKKQTLILRRHLAPERDVIYQLGHTPLEIFSKKEKRQIQELHDRITLYVEDIESIKERVINIIDELRGRLATHTGRAMYMFSLVAVIFLPLTFLTGLFGINVGGIPGSNTPWAFGVFSIIMLTIAIGLVWFFRRIRWF